MHLYICFDTQCVLKKGSKENKSAEKQDAKINTDDAQRSASYSTVKKAVKRVVPKTRDDSLDSYEEGYF